MCPRRSPCRLRIDSPPCRRTRCSPGRDHASRGCRWRAGTHLDRSEDLSVRIECDDLWIEHAGIFDLGAVGLRQRRPRFDQEDGALGELFQDAAPNSKGERGCRRSPQSGYSLALYSLTIGRNCIKSPTRMARLEALAAARSSQVSRTTSAGFLSWRMAMKVQCRRCPASVHSTNATWQTSFDLTQRHCSIFSAVSDSPYREALVSGRFVNGQRATLSTLRAWKISSRIRGTKPSFTFATKMSSFFS